MRHTALLALGSNLGNQWNNLSQALSLLKQEPGIVIVKVSRFYETEPMGMQAEDPAAPFLNAAAMVETTLSPAALLAHCLKIEQALGRQRCPSEASGYASRTLDLDILLYDALVRQEAGLMIPHPRMHERAFVLLPLAEIAPDWIHPVIGKTIQELALVHSKTSAVRCLPEPSPALH